jgi:hypothetical protein
VMTCSFASMAAVTDMTGVDLLRVDRLGLKGNKPDRISASSPSASSRDP